MLCRLIICVAAIGLAQEATAENLDNAHLRGSHVYGAPGAAYRVEFVAPSQTARAPLPSYPVKAVARTPLYVIPHPDPQSYGFDTEIGLRVWISSGKFAKDLYGDPRFSSNRNSRLTFSGLGAVFSGEVFGRAEQQGFFLKGFVGFGSIGRGRLNDEDFPPGIVPYSNTVSDQRNGYLDYVTFDFGYNLLTAPRYKLGPFIGYNYFAEKINAFGCTQIATNPVCALIIPNSVLGITENAAWNSLRLGLSGEVVLFDRLKLVGDAAWVPQTSFKSHDTHWLRPVFSAPIPENGTGNGVQLEASMLYRVTDAWSLGVGARYWHLQAGGTINIESVIVGLPLAVAQPGTFVTERYGTFAEAAYKFGM